MHRCKSSTFFSLWPGRHCRTTTFALFILIASGCWNARSVSTANVTRPRSERTRIDLEHDFGLLRPGETVQHRFTIKNDSEMRWTSANVRSYCRCTASTAGATSVSPGQSIDVTVGYTPSGANGPDSRAVSGHFAEPEAPYFWLKVRADVRDPLVFLPAHVVAVQKRKSHPAMYACELRNYTNYGVSLKSVKPSADWLKIQLQQAMPSTEKFVRQLWQGELVIDSAKVLPGGYLVPIEIVTDNPEVGSKTVKVEVAVVPPLQLVPNEFAFGCVSAGEAVDRKILLQVAPEADPLRPASISLRHDVGSVLKITCKERSERLLELTASLVTGKGTTRGPVRGTVHMAFDSGGPRPIDIPVSAEIK